MPGYGVRVEVAVAACVGGIGVWPAQPRGVRAQCAVDEQVAGKPSRAGLLDEGQGLRRAGHRLAPVTDDLDAVLGGADLLPVLGSADLRSGALVDGDDARAGDGVQGRPAGVVALLPGQQAARFGAHQMVGVGRQGTLRVESGDRRQSRHQVAQGRRGERRVDVDPRQVGRHTPDDGVEFLGGGCGLPGPPVSSSQPCAQIGCPGCVTMCSATSARQFRLEVAAVRSSPVLSRPVVVRWMWLSTKAGATNAPSRSTISASPNWARPRRRCPARRRRRRARPSPWRPGARDCARVR